MLIDGRRINDPIFDSSGIGRTFLVDVETLDRVELIRGPSSSLYGANAFFGVVNVITKRGRDLEGVEVAAAYGRFDTVEGRATYGKRFDNGVELLLSGTYFETNGDDHFYPDFDDPTTNNGVAAGVDDEEADNLFAKLSYQDFTLTGAYYSRDKTIPTAAWDTAFNDPRTGTVDEHTYLNVSYEHTFSRHLGTRADLFYQHYDYFGDYVYVVQLPIDELKIDRSFVRDIHVEEADSTIVKTILAMGQRLNLKVVAEGAKRNGSWNCSNNRAATNFKAICFLSRYPAKNL